jgi:dTDP-4-amino-4,6-dideoxygalactose transaminase
MAAMLCDLELGDEVIVPSYAFPTTASAFVRAGARIVFVDVDPTTMNVDPSVVAAAVTSRTRAIVALHYGGVACDMTKLAEIADMHSLILIEDAAQAIGATDGARPCGTIGTFGCLSFHESKNLHCGEGGALLCNDASYVQRAEIILEKGTDRSRFFRGEIDKYTWQDLGSSFVLGELNAAFLLAQLEELDRVSDDRRRSWAEYNECLTPLAELGLIELAQPPEQTRHNGHIFWIKVRDAQVRAALIEYLREHEIASVFHYQPLHAAPAGLRYGRFAGFDRYTSADAARLLRLPLYFGFRDAYRVSDVIANFLLRTRG